MSGRCESGPPRIALFDDWWPLHMGSDQITLDADSPDDWARLLGNPKFKLTSDLNGERHFVIDDDRARQEVHRLTQFRTCAICRQPMVQVSQIDDEALLLCLECGYWGGRGYRDWNSHSHSIPLRGVIGRYKPVANLDAASSEYLVSHLRRFPEAMTQVSPFRAERFVADLLKDYLDCEVHALGGRKDGGVDAYVLANDKIRTIIQVKWRESSKKAESVSTVREVGGTLLARGVPSGILVSTRQRFSKDAREEADLISTRTVGGLGQLSLELYDYHRILDMLSISNARLEDRWTAAQLWELHDRACVFDGAAMIPESMIPNDLSG